jgi:hypothetical protein
VRLRSPAIFGVRLDSLALQASTHPHRLSGAPIRLRTRCYSPAPSSAAHHGRSKAWCAAPILLRFHSARRRGTRCRAHQHPDLCMLLLGEPPKHPREWSAAPVDPDLVPCSSAADLSPPPSYGPRRYARCHSSDALTTHEYLQAISHRFFFWPNVKDHARRPARTLVDSVTSPSRASACWTSDFHAGGPSRGTP